MMRWPAARGLWGGGTRLLCGLAPRTVGSGCGDWRGWGGGTEPEPVLQGQRPALERMNRTGLLIALAIAAAAGLLFGLYPKLDLILSEPFFNPASGLWAAPGQGAARTRDAASALVALIALPAFLALGGKLIFPRRPMLLPGRAAVLMTVTLALGPGILANVILKDNWGRPRPIDVTEFRGDEHFLPWWDPRGECPKNCSFVAGEPSGA